MEHSPVRSAALAVSREVCADSPASVHPVLHRSPAARAHLQSPGWDPGPSTRASDSAPWGPMAGCWGAVAGPGRPSSPPGCHSQLSGGRQPFCSIQALSGLGRWAHPHAEDSVRYSAHQLQHFSFPETPSQTPGDAFADTREHPHTPRNT